MGKTKAIRQLNVALADHRDYPVFTGAGLLTDLAFLAPCIQSQQALLVTNETVAPLYLQQVKSALPIANVDVLILPDGEVFKTQDTVTQIYDALASGNHHRDSCIIALGGGVIGDMAGFAASTWKRGIPFIQIPTTLLAQVDASVGGKTGYNHPSGKNFIGSFWQPAAVVIDTDTLRSLPQRELFAGMAEVIKYAFLHADMPPLLDDFLANGGLQDLRQVDSLIERCCQIKAAYVLADEREEGQRALLNFGHTFAHALEAVGGYQRWLHGEAVAMGMRCALILSEQKGYCSSSLIHKLDSWLQACSLPLHIPQDVTAESLIIAMAGDKKIKQGHLRFVLCRKPGGCFIIDSVTVAEVQQALSQALER